MYGPAGSSGSLLTTHLCTFIMNPVPPHFPTLSHTSGIQEPPSDTGFYAQYQRPQVARVLDRATSALYRSPELRGQIRRHLLIRSARIPIAKFTLQSGLVIDLSVAGESGPQAAAYLARQVGRAGGACSSSIVQKVEVGVQSSI